MSSKRKFKIKTKSVAKASKEYDVTIGLEVHTHLKTRTKLFCNCPADFGREPNRNICPTCAGLPGALPVVNRKSLEMAVRAALALNLKVNCNSTFARKNYFYPDLPKGYQISQYDQPVSSDGHLDITVGGRAARIGIERAHLEEDAGKLVHTGAAGIAGASGSLVDLNRSSSTLLEIVSKPDISSPAQAVAYLKELRETLILAGAIGGHMEEGGLRCDANISLKPKGAEKLGVKVEIKNLNSFKFLEKALEYEIKRQRRALNNGEKIVQETRGFDPSLNTTFSMREKEEAHDYRYFPDPDLLPVVIDPELVESIKSEMPELPGQKRAKYSEWGLSREQSASLIGDVEMMAVFEDCLADRRDDVADFANWFLNSFIGVLNDSDRDWSTMKITASEVAKVHARRRQGRISDQSATLILKRAIADGGECDEIISSEGLEVVRDTALIERTVAEVLSENAEQVQDYLSGSEKIFNYLLGKVMQALKGRVDVDTARSVLNSGLNSKRKGMGPQ